MATHPRRSDADYKTVLRLFELYATSRDEAHLDLVVEVLSSLSDTAEPGVDRSLLALARQLRDRDPRPITTRENLIDLSRRVSPVVEEGLYLRQPLLRLALGQVAEGRFVVTGNTTDLELALNSFRDAILRALPDDPALHLYFNAVGRTLYRWFQLEGDSSALTDALRALREARSRAPGPELFARYTYEYATAIRERYLVLGEFADLTESIAALESGVDALGDRPHSDWLLGELGATLRYRASAAGHVADLDRAVSVLKQSSESPRLHPAFRSTYRLLHGFALHDRYEMTGSISDASATLEVLAHIRLPYATRQLAPEQELRQLLDGRLRHVAQRLQDEYQRTGEPATRRLAAEAGNHVRLLDRREVLEPSPSFEDEVWQTFDPRHFSPVLEREWVRQEFRSLEEVTRRARQQTRLQLPAERRSGVGFEKSSRSRPGGARYANAWLVDDAVLVGQPAELQFNIAQSLRGSLASERFNEPDFEEADSIPLTVLLLADDNVARVRPAWQPLSLPRQGDSEVVSFHVTPLLDGELAMFFEIRLARENVLLQALEIVISAEAPAKVPSG